MATCLAHPALSPNKIHDGYGFLPLDRSTRRVIEFDEPYDKGGSVEFKLVYDGVLWGSNGKDTRASHKHDIRRAFHSQLKSLWAINPHLDSGISDLDNSGWGGGALPKNRIDALATNWSKAGFRFVPMVTEELSLYCSLDVLFLRHGSPGSLIQSGDIDNRLKTLFDALRLPVDRGECGGQDPQDGEDPFFCLLQDDKLISHVSVNTDVLLRDPNGQENHVLLVIAVNLKPTRATRSNVVFL